MKQNLGGTVAVLATGLAVLAVPAPAHAAPDDTTPPIVTVTVSPVDGQNGWHVTPAAVRLVATDRSGIADASSSLTLTGAQAGVVDVVGGTAEVSVSADGHTTVAWSVSDTEGNTRTGSTAVAVDTGAPTAAITAGRSVVRQHDDVPLTAECGEAVSGLASCTLEGALPGGLLDTSTPGDVVVSAVAADNAGNRTTAPRTFRVVGTDVVPTVAITSSTPVTPGGWFRELPTVTVTATPGHDATTVTGVSRRVGDGATVTTAGTTESFQLAVQGTARVTASATDDLGGRTPDVVRDFKVDTVPPTATWSRELSVVERGRSEALSLQCQDATSGLSECGVLEGVDGSGNVLTDRVGTFTVRGRAVDGAGHRVEVELTYEVVEPAPPAASTLQLAAPARTSTRGRAPVTFRLGEGGLFGGTVVLTDNGREVGRYDVAAVVSRVADDAVLTVRLPRLTAGTHRLVATYLGSEQSAPASASAVVVALSPATAKAAYRVVGRTVVATVTVVGKDATATGRVVLRDGGKVIGSGVLKRGKVVITTTALKPGSHRLTATYNGSAKVAATATKARRLTLR